MPRTSALSEVFQRYLEARQSRYAGYSIRAFSRDLGLSPAFLSQILTNKRGLSPAKAVQVSKKLKLNAEERDYLIAHAILSTSRSAQRREKALLELKRLQHSQAARVLQKEEFVVISEWYHLAIFQCLFLKSYAWQCKQKGEVEYLSRFLKITPEQAEDALKRLCRLNLITATKEGHRPVADDLKVRSKVSSASIRKFHHQIIQKSMIAMEAQPFDDRFFNTTTLTIRKSDLPEMAKEYEDFYQRIVKKFSRKSDSKIEADSVYALSTQVFSLSH